MKTTKTNSIKGLIHVLLIVLLLPACANSAKEGTSSASGEQPDVDLHTAVISGNLEAVKQHIKAGSDLNGKDPFGGSTPLITAATFDKIDIAKALIEAGADLTIKNNEGSTALHAAAFFGRVEIVQLLIDVEADKGILNNFGVTARESVLAPFSEVKPIYEMMQQQLAPMGFQLNMEDLQQARPVIAMMLQ